MNVTDAMLVEAIRAHSDPPLCRVCGEPLTFGSSSHEGTKWAHYVNSPNGELWHQETMDHIDRSTRWNPRADPLVVAMATELLNTREALKRGGA